MDGCDHCALFHFQVFVLFIETDLYIRFQLKLTFYLDRCFSYVLEKNLKSLRRVYTVSGLGFGECRKEKFWNVKPESFRPNQTVALHRLIPDFVGFHSSFRGFRKPSENVCVNNIQFPLMKCIIHRAMCRVVEVKCGTESVE